MRPPTKNRRPAPPERSARPGVALAVTLIGSTAFVSPGEACPVIEPAASVSIEIAPGVDDEIQIFVFEDRDENGQLLSSDCRANLSVELAAFPSISNRLDTNGVARAIRESVAAIGADSCAVSIWYEDLEDELTLGEECVTAEFGFSSSDYWTSESEQSCWSPEELAEIEAWEREREAQDARDAAQADAFAAAADGIEDPVELEEWGESLDEEAARVASEEAARSSVETEWVEEELLWAGN